MKTLIHFAMLDDEASSIVDVEGKSTPCLIECEDKPYDIWVTGVGMDAVIRGIDCVQWDKYPSVINIGFAGTSDYEIKIGDIVQVEHVQNLDFRLLPEEPMVNRFASFEDRLNVLLTDYRVTEGFTSNRFVTPEHLEYIFGGESYIAGVYDMELAAVYDVCKMKGKTLSSFKVISDNLSIEDFELNFEELKKSIKNLVDNVLFPVVVSNDEKENEVNE